MATLASWERLIAAAAPEWGLRRLRLKSALALATGYTGASPFRPALRGWQVARGEADAVSLADLPALRERSSDLVRNAPIAAGAINAMVTNVVGTGLSLQSRVDAAALGWSDEETQAWQEEVEREFRLWAESEDCDVTRHDDFYGLQALVLRACLERGDCFVLATYLDRGGPYRLALQVIEADRVCNPGFGSDSDTLRAGIELSASGEPIAIHVCSTHPNNALARSRASWRRVPVRSSDGRRQVIHVMERRRPGQTRGVPVLAPVIEPLKQLARFTEAELQAAVVSGTFAVFMRMDPIAFREIFSEEDQQAFRSAVRPPDLSLDASSSLDGPGRVVNLLPGEEPVPVSSGRPNTEFDPFVQAILRQIGMALEVPFEVLVKHFTASYSAARAALLDAWRHFRCRREWLATHLCEPVFELWMDEAVALGRVRAPGYWTDARRRKAYLGAVWVGDGPGSIDPQREAEAARARIELGISTRAQESILHDGVDWEVKHRQLVKEERMRRRDGIAGQGIASADRMGNTDAVD